MNITVYLGAFPGNDPSFELAVKNSAPGSAKATMHSSMAVQNPVLWA